MKILHALFFFFLLATLSSQNIALAEKPTLTKFSSTAIQNGEYVRSRFLKLMKKPFINSNDQSKQQQKILIIGDSHAQDFLNAIVENKLLRNAQIRTRYIPTRCQIYLGDNNHRKWKPDDRQLCQKSDNLELAKTQIYNADVIILVALWRKWSVEYLPQTIKNLNLKSAQTLFVVGRRSFRKVESNQLDKLNNKERRHLRIEVDKDQLLVNNIMQNTLDKNVFINVHRLICGQGSTCPVFTNELKMISFDGGHLSPDGARYIGKQLFEKTQLSRLLN